MSNWGYFEIIKIKAVRNRKNSLLSIFHSFKTSSDSKKSAG